MNRGPVRWQSARAIRGWKSVAKLATVLEVEPAELIRVGARNTKPNI